MATNPNWVQNPATGQWVDLNQNSGIDGQAVQPVGNMMGPPPVGGVNPNNNMLGPPPIGAMNGQNDVLQSRSGMIPLGRMNYTVSGNSGYSNNNVDPVIGDFGPGGNSIDLPTPGGGDWTDTRVPGDGRVPTPGGFTEQDLFNRMQPGYRGDNGITPLPKGENGGRGIAGDFRDTRVPGEDGRQAVYNGIDAPTVQPSYSGLDGIMMGGRDSGGVNPGGTGTNKSPDITPLPEGENSPKPTIDGTNPVPKTPIIDGTNPVKNGLGTQVVPGNPKTPNQMNVADFGGQLVTDPSLLLRRDDPTTPQNESMFMSDQVKKIDPNAAGTNINGADPRYAQQGTVNTNVSQGGAMGAGQVDPRDAHTYDAQTTQANVTANGQAKTATGQVGDKAFINAPQIDMKGTGTGVNADGSTNYTGQALKEYAEQDLEAVNSKATVKGQLEQLTADFVDKDGNPKIPAYAQGQARNVGKIAAFKGMTGTAATAAMSTALLEASITVATQDASFYQTLTLQNLSNKQASTINRANVLAKMDQVNVDNRMAAAIQNSKNFMDMDMKNLDNEQQAQIVNSQARIQSILEDAKSVNAARLFNADSANETDRFYDQLNSNISQFNATQSNAMSQFNASEQNDMSQFDVNLNNQREQFYKEMQYNIDTSNAKWRQTVTLQDSQNAFDASALDVKNLIGISTEQLNQLWDRSDALLDYLWKSTESQLDRNSLLAIEKLKASAQKDAADSEGWGSIWGTIGGTLLGKIF